MGAATIHFCAPYVGGLRFRRAAVDRCDARTGGQRCCPRRRLLVDRQRWRRALHQPQALRRPVEAGHLDGAGHRLQGQRAARQLRALRQDPRDRHLARALPPLRPVHPRGVAALPHPHSVDPRRDQGRERLRHPRRLLDGLQGPHAGPPAGRDRHGRPGRHLRSAHQHHDRHAPPALARQPRRRRPRAHHRRLPRRPRLAGPLRLHRPAVLVHAAVSEDGPRALLPVQGRGAARPRCGAVARFATAARAIDSRSRVSKHEGRLTPRQWRRQWIDARNRHGGRELNPNVELIIRILVGTALGAIIGYERDIHGRPAGLRTHAIVALASATFMVVSTHLAYFQGYRPGDFTEIDGSRIAASALAGLGFLAGGAILRTGLSIHGLPTAAGLWLPAAIGLCAGGGMYAESVAATVIGVTTLSMLRRFEDKDDRTRRRLTLTLTQSALPTQALVAKLADLDLLPTVEGWNLESAASLRQLTLAVRLPRGDGEARLVAALGSEAGITRMQLDAVS